VIRRIRKVAIELRQSQVVGQLVMHPLPKVVGVEELFNPLSS
jgi:hypothetical protein